MAGQRGLERLARVLAAVRQAEEAALASYRNRAAASRRKAIALKAAGKRLPGLLGKEISIVDLKAHGSWQAHTDRGARQATAQADRIDEESKPLARRLAVTLGREKMVARMIDQKRKEVAARLARREEVDRMPFRSASGSGSWSGSTGSPGTE